MAARCDHSADGLDGIPKPQLERFMEAFGVRSRGTRKDVVEAVIQLKRNKNMSIGELMCAVALLELDKPFVREFECDIPERRRYDYYIPRSKTVIEYHGEPHFCVDYLNQGSIRLNECRRTDIRKAQYALDQKWKIIILDMECRNYGVIKYHIQKGLKARDKLYLSDELKLKYILTGLKKN